jgi:hypothetical protein
MGKRVRTTIATYLVRDADANVVSRFWQLLLSQGLLIGIGGGITWLPAAPVLAQW